MDLDILFLKETWLRSGSVDSAFIRDLTPAGYSFKHKPRVAKHRGGELGILFKSSIGLKVKGTITTMTSFKCMECSFTLNNMYIHGALIYRVPPSQKNKIPKSLFIDEFSKLMESLSIVGGKLLVLGDFNIPWNKEDHPEREQLHDLLSSCSLTQHVEFVTHLGGQTLDYVISRESDHLETSVSSGDVIADHTTVLITLSVSKPPIVPQKVSIRKLKAIDKTHFKQDMIDMQSNLILPDDCLTALDVLNNALRKVLNKHAPIKEKLISVRPKLPWYNSEVLEAKREKRHAERKWKSAEKRQDKNKEMLRDRFKEARNRYSYIIKVTKTNCYKAQVEECGDDQKKLFRVVNQLLYQKQATELPSYTSALQLAELFSTYCINKINKIRTEIEKNSHNLAAETLRHPSCGTL